MPFQGRIEELDVNIQPFVSFSDEETESFRRERLEAICRDYNSTPEEIRERFQPGSHGCHEAMHTASLLMDLLDNRLAEHPTVVLVPEWHQLAATAHDAIFNLYRSISDAHRPKVPG